MADVDDSPSLAERCYQILAFITNARVTAARLFQPLHTHILHTVWEQSPSQLPQKNLRLANSS